MRRLPLLLMLLLACGKAPSDAKPWDPTPIEEQMPEVDRALRAGEPDAALAELDRLEAAGALPDGALHYRALALADAGRAAEAIAAFQQELVLHPGNGHAHALLSELLIDAGRLKEADEHLVDARRFAPDHPMPKLLSGRLALLLDEDEQAQRFYRDYLLADPFGPPAIEAHNALAQIARRRSGEDSPDAQAHADTAKKLMEVNQYMASYRDRLTRDPGDIEAADGLTRAYMDLYVHMGGDPRLLEAADQTLQHILSVDPNNARALYNLGYVRIEQRRFDEALELTVRSLDADPGLARARLNHAKLLQIRGEVPAAISEYEQVIASAEETQDRARAHYELVLVYNDNADLDQRARALPHARALIAIEPQDPLHMQAVIDDIEAALAERDATGSDTGGSGD